MEGINEDEITFVNNFDCNDCGEEITLLQLKGKYMTVKSMAVPALSGAGLGSIGSGIAVFGTAFSGTIPFAAVGALAGATGVYVMGDTKDTLQCPECEADLEFKNGDHPQ
ncbi:hypothetical protein M0R88_15750 [Halorussus gelatinilyticus]|uniref:Uncharacterized protein n=1 Tax=Halorussus gelatinilyticus TaxID=2937524 RepID=A0A8U0IGE9_9EURY|nr:hypothetical protein [Halorussus gelatinilyticus]UPV99957.1 hypothetical protein M0R88_15750 [Halorussus gelatinilyticus]